MKICCITPDRGDRPEFTKHCVEQMKRQTIEVTEHLIIDLPVIDNKPDLIYRIQIGVSLVKRFDFDIVFIIENDDYYPDNYIETMLKPFETFPQLEAVGMYQTLYYHIFSQRYKIHNHPERSSLCFTAFKLSALDSFIWPPANEVFLDLHLWQHFKRYTLLKPTAECFPVGIKHGLGYCGGNGHDMGAIYYTQQDKNFEYLSTLIRPETLAFYKQMTITQKLKI